MNYWLLMHESLDIYSLSNELKLTNHSQFIRRIYNQLVKTIAYMKRQTAEIIILSTVRQM